MANPRPASSTMLLHAIAIAGAVVLAGCETTPQAARLAPSSPPGPTQSTSAADRTAAPDTAPTTTAGAAPDSATATLDRLLVAFNAEDVDGVAGVFGDDVVYVFHDTGERLVGPEVTAFFQGYFGRETGERATEPFHGPDGRIYFVGEFEDTFGGSATFVFDLEMDGERLVSMGDRRPGFEEVFAAGDIDDLHEAFNDRDVDRLVEAFQGMTYTSASGEEFTGAEAAAQWAESFGVVVTRTSGVFATGDDTYGFVTEHQAPGSGQSTTYRVEVERSEGRFTSMTEHQMRS